MRAGVLHVLLLILMYSAHATVPIVASLLHAADHRLAEARRLAGVDTAGEWHTHGDGGHRHDRADRHGASVEALLAAAGALEHETDPDAATAPPRLAAHLAPSLATPVPAQDRAVELVSVPAGPAAVLPTTPSTPPPRSTSRDHATRTA